MNQAFLKKVAIFLIIYFLGARLGLLVALGPGQVSPLWPPTGIVLAAILLFGYRFWPIVALAVVVDHAVRLPLGVAAIVTVGKTAEALLGAYLLRRFVDFSNSLDRVKDVLGLVMIGAILATMLGSAICVAGLAVLNLASWADFLSLWWLWWLGDGMGVLLAAPLMLVWATRPQLRITGRTIAELSVLMVCLFLACEAAFGGYLTIPSIDLPIAYLPFPVVMWAALRFGRHGAVTSVFLTSVRAVAGTAGGHGPFARASTMEGLVLLQAFVAAIVLTGLVLGAVTTERGQVGRALRKSQRRYNLATNAGAVGVWDWDLETNDIYVDPLLKGILGYQDHEIRNHISDWDKLVHPDDLERVQAEVMSHRDGETAHYEVSHRAVHKDGSIRWFFVRGNARRDKDGRPVRMTGTSIDITTDRHAEEALEQSERRARKQLAELEHLYQTAPVGFCLVDREIRWVRINEQLARFHGKPVSEHIGRRMRDLIPEIAAKSEPVYRKVFETGEPIVDAEVSGITPADPDTERHWLASFYPLKLEDGTVYAVSNVVQDITSRKRAEMLQTGMSRVLELLAEGRDIVEVFDELARTVESQLGASSRCSVLLADEAEKRLRFCAAPNLPKEFHESVDGLPIGSAEGSCGTAAYRRETVIVANMMKDPLWEKYREVARSFGLKSSWSVPILSESDQVLGTLCVFHTRSYEPNSRETDVTQKAASLARVAIEHTKALATLQDREAALRQSHAKIKDLAGQLIAAQEEERRRLSRELHDGLNQNLAALSFEIGFLRSRLPEENADMRERLRKLQTRAAQVIEDVRRMSRELHPASLEHVGLVSALRTHCLEIEKQEEIRAKLTLVKVPENIPREVALCLYRVAQEALRNAVRHSGAPEVRVTLTGADGSLELYVADSGSGFDSDRTQGGLGLVSMEERVRLLGGSFRITSQPRLGTRLEVRVPVSQTEEPVGDPTVQKHRA